MPINNPGLFTSLPDTLNQESCRTNISEGFVLGAQPRPNVLALVLVIGEASSEGEREDESSIGSRGKALQCREEAVHRMLYFRDTFVKE